MERFPNGFLWGAATSAYQVEGAVGEDGRGLSVWDVFSHTPGNTFRGDTGDIACDQYHRLDEDLDLMADLGLKAYRFSVAWPRVLPEGRGRVNRKGLDYYKRMVDGLNRRGIAPVVTLFHWDLPQVLQDEGGWLNRDCAGWFAEYAGAVGEALAGEVSLWITHNETYVTAWAGYGVGLHAPGVSDDAKALEVTHHLLLSHGLAAQALGDAGAVRDGGGEVGISLFMSPAVPATDDPEDEAATRRADGQQNRLFLDPCLGAATRRTSSTTTPG